MTSTGVLDVLIVGGSLGGLMAGLALRRRGHRVRIFERSAKMADRGAGIVCQDDTLHFFRNYDATQTRLDVVSKQRQYLDRSGKVIKSEDKEQRMTSWDLLYWILRANFDNKQTPYTITPMFPSISEATYHLSHTVKTISYDAPRVTVTYTTSSRGTLQTTTADVVIAADGASSALRSLLCPGPDSERTYAGYVAFRGLVPERTLSPGAHDTLVPKFSFFHAPRLQFLTYAVPGHHGTVEEGERRVNWVWYLNCKPDDDVFMDKDGNRHTLTLPAGKMSAQTKGLIRRTASERLPPVMRELVYHTDDPFMQGITDALSPQMVFHDGHVLLVGDSASGPRPHTAASTNQAAMHALLLGELFPDADGPVAWAELQSTLEGKFQDEVRTYAEHLAEVGKDLGDRSQFGEHPQASK